MSEPHPTAPPDRVKSARPCKPRPDFPLTFHPAGYWCKKVLSKLHYFGPRFNPADPTAAAAAADAALAEYNLKADALHAGRKPREDTDGLTVKQLCNRFLNAKREKVDIGELSPRTWEGYKLATDAVVAAFGKSRLVSDLDPDDFAKLRNKLARKYGPHGLGTQVQSIRSVFKYGNDEGLLDRPVLFGEGFVKPSKKTLRVHRAEQGKKLFSPGEIRRLIDGATVHHRAMILLGINAGFGNSDCGNLRLDAVDLVNAVIDFPRPKTGVARRSPLWPETVAALTASLDGRPEPKNDADAGLFFITRLGGSWSKETAENPISDMTCKLLRKLGINGRAGLGFYTLRHTFRTVADEAKDQPAADYIMGHEVPHMSSVYRETISDDRLRAVVDHVRNWLFPPPQG
jgi:integrase